MTLHPEIADQSRVDGLYLPASSTTPVRSIHLARPATLQSLMERLSPMQRAWLESLRYKAAARKQALLPGADGAVAGAILGLGDLPERAGAEPGAALLGLLPAVLPAGDYEIASDIADPTLAAVAWASGPTGCGATNRAPPIRCPGSNCHRVSTRPP
jgi:leucyl aminopeptidase